MPAGELTYGEERKWTIARALALEPRYLRRPTSRPLGHGGG